MIAIDVTVRALAAARAVDPDVSTAAVHAALAVALADHEPAGTPAGRAAAAGGRGRADYLLAYQRASDGTGTGTP